MGKKEVTQGPHSRVERQKRKKKKKKKKGRWVSACSSPNFMNPSHTCSVASAQHVFMQ